MHTSWDVLHEENTKWGRNGQGKSFKFMLQKSKFSEILHKWYKTKSVCMSIQNFWFS